MRERHRLESEGLSVVGCEGTSLSIKPGPRGSFTHCTTILRLLNYLKFSCSCIIQTCLDHEATREGRGERQLHTPYPFVKFFDLESEFIKQAVSAVERSHRTHTP